MRLGRERDAQRSSSFKSRKRNSSREDEDQQVATLNDRFASLLSGHSLSRLAVGFPRCSVDCNKMPSLEYFAPEVRSIDAKKKIIEDLSVGDVLCVRVRRVELAGVYVQPLCVLHPFRRTLKYIGDFQVLIARDLRSGRNLRPNDLLKVVVAEPDETHPQLNLLQEDADLLSDADLPPYFRNGELLDRGASFDDYLSEYLPLENPSLDAQYDIETNYATSFLNELQGEAFSYDTRAPNLRRVQNEELSMQSALKGVQRVRSGEYTVAIQHFNKALEIFHHNVEALVGRAATYANMGQFGLAEEDLDNALQINPEHRNAQAYMVEILLQVAKSLTEKKLVDDAKVKYEKILRIKDDTRARDGLRHLEKSPSVVETHVVAKKRTLSLDEERKKKKEDEQERKRRKRDAEKLAEIERFISELKKAKN